MKATITVLLLFISSLALQAQSQLPGELYLVFEFMRVDEDQSQAYWETETFWSKIH